jgi:transposase
MEKGRQTLLDKFEGEEGAVAYRRLSMRRIREILRLKFEAGLSQRAIARALGVSNSTVSEAFSRLGEAGLAWPLPEGLTDAELEKRLYRARGQAVANPREPDWALVQRKLTGKYVTLRLAWEEYLEACPGGYGYSWFCESYRIWQERIDVVMRQEHKAGEKLFVDWAGKTLPYLDAESGEVRGAHLFLAVLGASNYTYAEVFENERMESFLTAHVHAFEFFGGAPELLVPDNLKTGVSKADRYEAEIAAPYEELAAHYGAAVAPARLRKPRDKAKVEGGVLFAYRALAAPLRARSFFGLADFNIAIRAQLTALNERPFQKLPGSRKSFFTEREAPLLRPLPAEPFSCRTRKLARVHIDYHVELEGHYYSVPYQLVREQVELRFDACMLEVYHEGVRVALHVRGGRKGQATTDMAHMPETHRAQAAWTPERMAAWAAQTGPGTAALCEAIMAARPHPALGFRSCLGVLRLESKYGAARLEAACARALAAGGRSYGSVRSILERGLDALPAEAAAPPPGPSHANLRGPGYYD